MRILKCSTVWIKWRWTPGSRELVSIISVFVFLLPPLVSASQHAFHIMIEVRRSNYFTELCFITGFVISFFSHFWVSFCILILLQPDISFENTLVSLFLWIFLLCIDCCSCFALMDRCCLHVGQQVMCMKDEDLSESSLNVQFIKWIYVSRIRSLEISSSEMLMSWLFHVHEHVSITCLSHKLIMYQSKVTLSDNETDPSHNRAWMNTFVVRVRLGWDSSLGVHRFDEHTLNLTAWI